MQEEQSNPAFYRKKGIHRQGLMKTATKNVYTLNKTDANIDDAICKRILKE